MFLIPRQAGEQLPQALHFFGKFSALVGLKPLGFARYRVDPPTALGRPVYVNGAPWSLACQSQLVWEAESLALNSWIEYSVTFGKLLNLSEPQVHTYKWMGEY